MQNINYVKKKKEQISSMKLVADLNIYASIVNTNYLNIVERTTVTSSQSQGEVNRQQV